MKITTAYEFDLIAVERWLTKMLANVRRELAHIRLLQNDAA